MQFIGQTTFDFVIVIDGGSVLDTGKVVTALITNPIDLLDYLEIIGRSKKLSWTPEPYIAIPTASGTGAEISRNAVLGNLHHRVKVSMRSPLMLSGMAVVGPVITYSMLPDVTAGTGLDALAQLMAAFVSSKANPLTGG